MDNKMTLGERMTKAGRLMVLHEAVTLQYYRALEKANLERPHLPINDDVWQLLETINKIQAMFDEERKAIAGEIVKAKEEELAAWQALGLPAEHFEPAMQSMQELSTAPLRYATEG